MYCDREFGEMSPGRFCTVLQCAAFAFPERILLRAICGTVQAQLSYCSNAFRQLFPTMLNMDMETTEGRQMHQSQLGHLSFAESHLQ
jgi:hypothetical protein